MPLRTWLHDILSPYFIQVLAMRDDIHFLVIDIACCIPIICLPGQLVYGTLTYMLAGVVTVIALLVLIFFVLLLILRKVRGK